METSRSAHVHVVGSVGTGVRLLMALALAILALPALATASRAQESAPADNALVRFIHASPDAPSVDFYVDEMPVARGLQFGVVSDYVLVPEGSHTVRIVPVDGDPEEQALLESDHDFDADSFYVAAVGGYLNDLETNVFPVDIDELDEATNARVRVINLIPDSADLDIYQVGGDAIAESVDFGRASDYTVVPANTYELEVRSAEDGTVALTAPAYQVEANTAYDLVLIGEVGQESVELRALGTPTNQTCGTLLGIGTSGDACVRFVHASPDAPQVDIYLDDAEQPAVSAVEFGVASDFLPLAEGSHRIRIVPTGGTLEEPVVDTDVEVDAGQAYIVAATNPIEDLEAQVHEVDLSPIGGDQARIRTIHDVPNLDNVDVAASGTVIFENLGEGDATEYDLIQAGTYDVEIRPAGDPAPIVTSPGVVLEAGFVYDIFAIGSEEAGNLTLLVVGSPAPSTASMGVVPAETSATPPATPESAD